MRIRIALQASKYNRDSYGTARAFASMEPVA
jgi:hypothetical protein